MNNFLNGIPTHGPFHMLLTILSSKSMRIVETKEDDEKAITMRVSPTIADRLDAYAKAARTSRSTLIRILIEGALETMDEIVIMENDRHAEAAAMMEMAFEDFEREKREKLDRAKAVLEQWQK